MGILSRLMRRDSEEFRKHSPQYSPGESGLYWREASIDTRAVNEESRTVELAFSSDKPIRRRDFMGQFDEILMHDQGSCRLDRMNDGAAVLVNHNSDDQVGVVQSARIEDGVGRATVRLGRSARAEEIFQDVVDGIRSKISVGYRIHAFEEIEGKADSVDEVRITDWEPLEVSFVAVPADSSVGVGRNHQSASGAEDMPFSRKKTPENPEGNDGGAPQNPAITPDEQRQEITPAQQFDRADLNEELTEIGKRFGEPELAQEIIDLEGSVDDLRKAILAKRQAPTPVIQTPFSNRDGAGQNRVNPEGEIVLNRQEKLRAFGNEESAYRAGMWALATMFGDRRAERWCRDHGVRVMTEAAFTKGGAIVPDELSNAIIDLRESYGVARQQVRVVTMNTDTLTVPRRTGGLTAYAVGEEDATTESDKSWDNVNLVAREWSALARFSMSYAEDAPIDVAADLADEMAYAFSNKEDDCWLNGDGTSTYHGIQGLRHKLVNGTYIGDIAATSGDDTIPEIIAGDLDVVRGALPQYAAQRGRGARWLCSKLAKNRVFDAITRAAGGNTMETLGGMPRASYLGDEIVISQVMPNNASTVYNNLIMLLYGNFDLSTTMGSRRGFTVQVLRERYAEYRQIGVIGTTRFDIVNHDLGDGSNYGPVVGLKGTT